MILSKTTNHTTMLCYTITDGQVKAGIKVDTITVHGGNVYNTFHAVTIGAQGEWRSLATVPVHGLNGDLLLSAEATIEVPGKTFLTCTNANGNFASLDEREACLIALRTTIGLRGGNMHTGWKKSQGANGVIKYRPFPCIILATGNIASGFMGNRGHGEQHLVIARRGDLFRINRWAGLYNKIVSHYYHFDGTSIKCYTPEEADAQGIDLFAEKL